MNNSRSKNNRMQTSKAALVSLGMGLVLLHPGSQAGYLLTSSGEPVMAGQNECWTSVGGMSGGLEACGDTISVAKFEVIDKDRDGVPDAEDQCPETPQIAKVDAKGCALDSDNDTVADYQDKCPGTPVDSKVDSRGCGIIEDLVLKVTTDHFKFDSSRLESGMIGRLDEVIAKVATSPGNERLNIIGHTDSSGPDNYNQGLSERRAQAVAEYLIEQGFTRDKLSVSGMGESQPVADNSKPEGRTMNRRVEILTH